MKIHKKYFFSGGGGSGVWLGRVGGVRVDVNKKLKFLGKFTKKFGGGGGRGRLGGEGSGGGSGWWGGQGGCERNVWGRR